MLVIILIVLVLSADKIKNANFAYLCVNLEAETKHAKARALVNFKQVKWEL